MAVDPKHGALRAELPGECPCCRTKYERGAWLRYDARVRRYVLDGHQSAVTK